MKYVMRVLCVRTVAVLCMALAVASGPAWAQSAATGNIEGVVTDSSGGVLPGVPVIVRNMDTNVAARPDDRRAGPLSRARAAAGRYEVSATLTGFQRGAAGRISGPGRPDGARRYPGCSRPA